MEILVKETATLHKVLSRYLAPIVVEVRNLSLLSVLGRPSTICNHPRGWQSFECLVFDSTVLTRSYSMS